MKIIGALIIIIVSVISAYLYEKNIKTKAKHIEEIISFIKYIKSQIEYFSRTLNEIYTGYDVKSEYIYTLIENNGQGAQVSKEVDALIEEFFSNIGKGYKSEEIKLCDYTSERLYASLTQLQLEIPNKIKIFRSLSLFVGVCIIILLV